MSKSPDHLFATLNRVQLAEAQQCITHYRNFMRDQGVAESDIILAFRISRTELMSTLEITDTFDDGYKSMRVYLGMADDMTIEGSRMRLFLVPVEDSTEIDPGTDVLPSGKVGVDYDGPYVYDFNTPCPATCDLQSPLLVTSDV